MPQYARPSADTVRDNWFDQADGIVNLYTRIDESIFDDADYIKTQATPSADVFVTKLTTVEDPISSINHTIRYRYGKDVVGGDSIDLTIQLRQGYVNEGAPGTLIATIATLTNIADGWNAGTYTLTAGEADAITNYADLFIRFVGNRP